MAAVGIRHVIWDFNGTLLDDVDCCVATVNELMHARGLGSISRTTYLERFRFPVRDFYADLGFDVEREDFEALSHTYIERYVARLHDATPHAGALDALDALRGRGLGQSVLSAMEAVLLRELLARFALDRHLTHVRGLEHRQATSKVALGVSLAQALDARPHEVLLVGDTEHDAEAAAAIGCQCLLFEGGHQAPARLHATGLPVVRSLDEVTAWVSRG